MYLMKIAIVFFLASCTQGESKQLFTFKPAIDDRVAARVGEKDILMSELVVGIESDIFELQMKIYELKMEKLRMMILDELVDSQSDKGSMTTDEYINEKILANISVSEAEMKSFIEEKSIPPQHVNQEFKDRLKNFLAMEKKKKAVDEWMIKKKGANSVSVYFRPERPTFNVDVGNAYFKGPEDAKVTIVEFSDFQCKFCADASDILSKLLEKYPKDLRVVYKHFPLPFHRDAKIGSVAALCAGEQDKSKFWKFHDYMFANQSKLSVGELKAQAKSLSLNTEEFDKCLDENRHLPQVEADIAQGKELGVKATPTIYVNGQILGASQDINVFEELIREHLGR